jgi:hypothetical protein
LTDRDDLVVAREELENLAGEIAHSGDDKGYLHGLDTAIAVLAGLIEKLPVED